MERWYNTSIMQSTPPASPIFFINILCKSRSCNYPLFVLFSIGKRDNASVIQTPNIVGCKFFELGVRTFRFWTDRFLSQLHRCRARKVPKVHKLSTKTFIVYNFLFCSGQYLKYQTLTKLIEGSVKTTYCIEGWQVFSLVRSLITVVYNRTPSTLF